METGDKVTSQNKKLTSFNDLVKKFKWKKIAARSLFKLFQRRKPNKRDDQLNQVLQIRAIISHVLMSVVRIILIATSSGVYGETRMCEDQKP